MQGAYLKLWLDMRVVTNDGNSEKNSGGKSEEGFNIWLSAGTEAVKSHASVPISNPRNVLVGMILISRINVRLRMFLGGRPRSMKGRTFHPEKR